MDKVRINNKLHHFVTKFKDNENSYYVFKFWLPTKQRWKFEIIEEYILRYVYNINPKEQEW